MSARRPASIAPMLRAVARVPAVQARCHSIAPLDGSLSVASTLRCLLCSRAWYSSQRNSSMGEREM
jgi:hypothetical protein